MRTHRWFPALTGWIDRERLARIASPERLLAARLEPAIRFANAAAFVDLVFADGERFAPLPLIEVSPRMIASREYSPFIWPALPCAGMDEARIDALEALLLPWLESLIGGRSCSQEQYRLFSQDAHAFEAAREAGFIGAAPYRRVLCDAAPYVYAARYAAGKRVALADAAGALGCAILRAHTGALCADLGDAAKNDLASRWYGIDAFGKPEISAPDVVISRDPSRSAPVTIGIGAQGEGIVGVATPVPRDIMIAFDSNESPVALTFRVACEARAPQRTIAPFTCDPAGGSSGRIALLVRNDYRTRPDADCDQARALAGLLCAEGFDAQLVTSEELQQLDGVALVHAFGAAQLDQLLPGIAHAKRLEIPLAISPLLDDLVGEGIWGSRIVPVALAASADETDFGDYASRIKNRRLFAAGIEAVRAQPYDGFESQLRELLASRITVFASSEVEEALLRSYGFAGVAHRVAGYLWEPHAPEMRVAAAGTGEFVLVHAPIEPRGNQVLIARAAVQARIPVLFAGPVADAGYAALLREVGDERCAVVGEPSASQAATLYRQARVYADLAWYGYGLQRSLRGAASGAALVAHAGSGAAQTVGPAGVWCADRADPESIALALGDAWLRGGADAGALAASAARARQAGDAGAMLRVTVAGYAAGSEQTASAH